MPKYRVIGSKLQTYWTVVEADDKYDLYDKCLLLNATDWNDLENDNIIEPVDSMEEEEDNG